MPTYARAKSEVTELASEVLTKFESYQSILDAKVRIDYIMAWPNYHPKTGEPRGNAISRNGVKAYGLCRIIGLKDRAMGRGDVEILLDAEWWDKASEKERAALLDHELHHIMLKKKKKFGTTKTDDLGRPVLAMRKHDFEVGWFAIVAQRHGEHSMERQQAKTAVDLYGQYFWPFTNPIPIGKAA